ncbi:MAG: hypothetical protein A3K13_13475 [Gemmatimonadetes bacterium RIFCSPLOWO2_12_FULL_68_9]|nr:MAG: hypothetical protein A3K13_13475 [Gemmatimonadetes bacterium RIFCSPLOWO2_12_FULL_68_9]
MGKGERGRGKGQGSDLRARLQDAVTDAYRVEKELGGGGMSRVFLAEEVRLGRKVVIKVLPPEMAAGVNVERFEREIQLAARLQHPHVVPLLTAGSAGDILYYIMPFIKGEALRAKLAREGELPVGEAVRILRDVADALAYAHREGVIHRDIKPDNVLLSDNHAVVTDFGVAKAVSASTGESSLTSLGVALGTPAYMAPEQAVADPHVDHRADIYALGALAYEMLTGRPPFTGPNPQAVLSAHVTEAAEPVTKHRDTVPPALNEVVMRCLAKKAADRWQKAEEVRAQFEAMVTPTGGMTPTGTQPVLAAGAAGAAAAAAQAHPVRVAGLFGLASVGVLAIVYAAVQLIGLPDWVFWAAIALLGIGLPIMVLTGRRERQRAIASMTGVRMTTPVGLERHFTWQKAILGGGLAFAGLALVATVYMVMRLLGIGPVGSLVASGVLKEQERLLVTDFENATPDSALGKTVTDLLRIALSQSQIVTVMEPAQVAAVLVRMGRSSAEALTPELAAELSAREGIKAFVAGEIRPVGGDYIISARLVAAGTREALVAVSEPASGSEGLFKAVGKVSAHLRERIGESLRAVRADPPLERLTTKSVEALRLYTQAQKVADEGDYGRSIALLEEAVARDSTFAMAWRRLGAYKTNPNLVFQMGASGDSALRRAYALRDRLSDRERYHVEAMYWSRAEHQPEKAVTSYLALLEKYPNDGTAWNNLAVQYQDLGRFAERDAAGRAAIDKNVAGGITYVGLLSDLQEEGQLAEADTILKLFAERFPTSANVPQWRANLAAARMQWDEVKRVAEEARIGQPVIEVWAYNQLSDLAALEGKLAEAARLRAEAIRRNAQRTGLSAADRDFLIELDALERQIWFAQDRKAWAPRVEQAWRRNLELVGRRRVADRRYPRFIGDFLLVERPERAQRVVEELVAGLEESLRGLPDVRDGQRRTEAAMVALRGQYREAVATLQAIRRDNPQCALCDLIEIADAYDRGGDADSAAAYYARYLETAGNRLSSDAHWMARSLKRLGELHEAKGDRQKAIDYYNRLVELWKDADPELQPLVRDVKARLARLVGEKR